MDEPIISQWTNPNTEILKTLHEVNLLLQRWAKSPPGPFYPFSDALWLQTAEVLKDAGLPWHNNNLNLPDEIDPSWPFHFKEFERQAVLCKGARVGDEHASGYICPWSEANQYAIRALQQEIRRQRPTQKPLLVAGRMDSGIIQLAGQHFGLEIFQIGEDWEAAKIALVQCTRGSRPIIFAATLANNYGQADDLTAIDQLSDLLPVFLHIDASRTFDYITTLSESARQRVGTPKLLLCHPYLDDTDNRTIKDNTIRAATIIAAGMNCTYPPPVVVLKPRTLGSLSFRQVEYVRGTDGTLAGSRDSLGPLLVYLQEVRFGPKGIQEIYQGCQKSRRSLRETLIKLEIPFESPPASLDIIVRPRTLPSLSVRRRWGLILLSNGAILVTVQPSVTSHHVEDLVNLFTTDLSKHETRPQETPIGPIKYPLPLAELDPLRERIAGWRTSAVSSSGYPLNQAPYSALGPIISHFLPVMIESKWAKIQGSKILKDRKNSFHLSLAEHNSFAAAFTTGSTMGNRAGLHTALTQHPGAFVYFSTATHYSIKKTVLDSDELTGRWTQHRIPRFAEIAADHLGRMIPEAFAKRVRSDKALCKEVKEPHQVVLLANMGTTFVGGRDDILALRQSLHGTGSKIAYIHCDGALNFGFGQDLVSLGTPDTVVKKGLPVVQGITLSHHKAFGIMVSGEVICYNPGSKKFVETDFPVDPRIVFETWLFQRMYSPQDLSQTSRYCVNNANRLRDKLASIGVATRFNESSFITLLERLPPWMIQDFHLAPEGDWVHYITMPHITPPAVDRFVETVSSLDDHFANVFTSIGQDLDSACGQRLSLLRVRCQDEMRFSKISRFARNLHNNGGALETFCSDTFRRRYAYSAMSFAAFDAQNDPYIVFLAATSAQRELFPGPVLLTPEFSGSNDRVQHLASKAFSLLAHLFALSITRIDR